MKTKFLLPAFVLVTLGLFTFTGCATNGGRGIDLSAVTKPQRLERAAFLAATVHLKDHKDDAAKIQAVRSKLSDLAGNPSVTSTNLRDFLTNMPLKGDAALYREGALLILDDVETPNVPLPTERVRELIFAVDRGVGRALESQ